MARLLSRRPQEECGTLHPCSNTPSCDDRSRDQKQTSMRRGNTKRTPRARTGGVDVDVDVDVGWSLVRREAPRLMGPLGRLPRPFCHLFVLDHSPSHLSYLLVCVDKDAELVYGLG